MEPQRCETAVVGYDDPRHGFLAPGKPRPPPVEGPVPSAAAGLPACPGKRSHRPLAHLIHHQAEGD
jgi:hypothetical protein